jgi:hypothetical protein
MKNRSNEMRFSKKFNYLFNNNIVPLYEIITDEYEPKYKKDPYTGEFVYEIKPNNVRKTKVQLPPTPNDIITLDVISKNLNGKKAFIDYFRYDESEYPKLKIDTSQVELAFKLSRDINEYIKHIKLITNYSNFIPVISIKSKCSIDITLLVPLINELQSKCKSIAIRITYECFDKYSKVISSLLRKDDFLLYDIREQNVFSMIFEFKKLDKVPIIANKVLLNSPRPFNIANGQFEVHGVTSLIDNSVVKEYKKNNFIGFGDFGGLRDILPVRGGSNGKGAALALLYEYSINAFYSYVNPDTDLGPRGYKSIIKTILSERHILDPKNDCPALDKIKNLDTGNFPTWIYITLIRYVYQIYTYHI